ncbi:hypothetical protein DRN98_10190 [Methanosarcinales archaeon]|nr:MAG: hypothetical protein DRN98_10190 [Methanosarcinales archaeon]
MVLVIAHKGFSGSYPENTLLSIRKALELGVDGIEVDVRVTKDNKLVLFHDTGVKRLTGRKGRIRKKTYAELSKLRVNQAEKIPLLSQALNFINDKKYNGLKYFILDIKIAGFEKQIITMIKKKKVMNKIILSSKNTKVLERARRLSKNIRLAYVVDNRPDKLRLWRGLHKKIGLYSVHAWHKRPISTKKFIRDTKKKGLRVMVWTVNKPERMKKLVSLGVDGIITDHPDKLIRIVEESLG